MDYYGETYRADQRRSKKINGVCGALKGRSYSFLWLDPEDYEEKGIQLPLITVGTYQAVMKMGDYVEPVECIEKVAVYIDGVKQESSKYTITNGTVKFKTAPASTAKSPRITHTTGKLCSLRTV